MNGGRSGSARTETLLRAEGGRAAAVLAASHADYPASAWLWPDPLVRRRALLPFLRATVADAAAHGSATVGRDEQGVCAVALWLPPGGFPWSPGRKLRAVPALVRAALAAPNVSFYRVLGFEVTAPRLEHLPGGPPCVGLRRPPRR